MIFCLQDAGLTLQNSFFLYHMVRQDRLRRFYRAIPSYILNMDTSKEISHRCQDGTLELVVNAPLYSSVVVSIARRYIHCDRRKLHHSFDLPSEGQLIHRRCPIIF